MDCIYDCCFVLSRWDGEMAYLLPTARISVVGTTETGRLLTTTSTPTQSTPTQYAGNIGAQPKDGMRGQRLSEVAVRARRSAHRPFYMDVGYTCTDFGCAFVWTDAAHTHTHSSHITTSQPCAQSGLLSCLLP